MTDKVITPIKSYILKSQLKQLDDSKDENDKIRIHRAISWLKSAEDHEDNPDIQFISLWIAFNSCYARNDEKDIELSELRNFKDFIYKLVEHDEESLIFELLWNKFSGPIRLLIDNKYAYKNFWDSINNNDNGWEHSFEISNFKAFGYLNDKKVEKFLMIVLERLYTVRNQLIHGGATYMSKVNRAQVKDAGQILRYLIPVIIDIMIKNIDEDWGDIYYPVIK